MRAPPSTKTPAHLLQPVPEPEGGNAVVPVVSLDYRLCGPLQCLQGQPNSREAEML